MNPILAALPILLVTALLLAGRDGTRSAALAWLAALLTATMAFGAGPGLLWISQLRALALSIWVLYIVWSALLLAAVVRDAGGFAVIARGIGRLTQRPTLQLLILAWVFSSFLQGVTGFGVPVAVVAPLLVGLGYPALTAVVAASIGHAWAVTFGSVGSSMLAMLAATGREARELAPASAILLGLAVLACGAAVAHSGGGWRELRRSLPALFTIGPSMALAQVYLAGRSTWPLASFGAASLGLLVAALLARLDRSAAATDANPPPALTEGKQDEGPDMSMASAFMPYLVLTLLVGLAQLPALAAWLARPSLQLELPATRTALGWENPAGATRAIEPFGHIGALIAYAATISWWSYRRMGQIASGSLRRIGAATLRGVIKPSLSIAFLLGMAQAMSDSGMTQALAEGLGRQAGSFLPLAAAGIGALGAFVTGSNTNSNLLFAGLELESAQLLGISVSWTLAAQNLGGALGSAFAPAKIVVGVSTVGLAGQEGRVLRALLIPGLTIVFLGGVAAWLLSRYFV